jgi:enediyne biosynthesis protein E4
VTPSSDPNSPRPVRLGRRRRRLYTTLVALAVVGGAGLWLGIRAYRAQAPQGYVPGQDDADITSKLDLGIPAEAPDPKFTDVTEAAGLGGFSTFAGPRTSQLPEDMGGGVAWGDIDGDGDEDLLLVAAGVALTASETERPSSIVYENLGDGTFEAAAGIPGIRINGMGAAWGDHDADGDLDLVVTGYNAIRLYENERGSLGRDYSFPDSEGFWAGPAWGDYDGDGDLDLYVCGYVRYRAQEGSGPTAAEQYGTEVPYTLNPSSFAPQPNLLYRNDGAAGFVELAEELGVSNPTGRSLSALWHDFDDDGLLDLYVANDVSDNAFYHNTGAGFEDISHPAFVADYRGAMGLAAADWNDDGDDDLFITHWIAQENALYDSLLSDLGPPAEGGPAVRFMDAADMLGLGQVALQRVGWGAAFADFDHDGRQDLVVANGSTFENDAEPKGLRPQPSFLFWNRDGEAFHDITPLVPALAEAHVSRGLAVSDYDNDGDIDIAIVDLDGGVRLLRNDIEKRGNWIKLRLRATPNGRAIAGGTGASIVVRSGGVARRRSVSSGSYLSQNSLTLHIGIGAAESIDGVDVRWRAGATDTYTGLEPNATWLLVEGAATPERLAQGARATATQPPSSVSAREATTLFWQNHRAAMDATKVDGDYAAAIPLFREALRYDPDHEDALYYLGACLVAMGDTDGALASFARLVEVNPSSHRGLRRWGTLRASTAESAAHLDAAYETLARAQKVNQEETGVLLALGEVDLLRGRHGEAERRFSLVCQANERSVAGFFLRGYVAWQAGDAEAARAILQRATDARGDEKTPEGAVMEGDVLTAMHTDATPLAAFTRTWEGNRDPDAAYRPLANHLRAIATSVSTAE